MWIQPRHDPYKKWLQMHYCITEGDINMVISEWPDEWRILTITREVPETTTEGEAEHAETQPPKSKCPRNHERAKASRLKQTKGQSRHGPRRGRKRLRSRLTDSRNKLREQKRLPQTPSHRNQREIRDQPCRQEVCTRNQRHNDHR
jgi:hypothetical protein